MRFALLALFLITLSGYANVDAGGASCAPDAVLPKEAAAPRPEGVLPRSPDKVGRYLSEKKKLDVAQCRMPLHQKTETDAVNRKFDGYR